MKKTFCDACGSDITTVSSGWTEFMYVVVPVVIRNLSPVSYGEGHEEPFGGDFCSIKCLKKKLNEKDQA